MSLFLSISAVSQIFGALGFSLLTGAHFFPTGGAIRWLCRRRNAPEVPGKGMGGCRL